MILKALVHYYGRLRDDPDLAIAPPGFERKAIPFLLVLRSDGSVSGIHDTRESSGARLVARAFLVPQGEKKTSGVRANLLWDTPQYVLGVPKSGAARDQERAVKAAEAFADRFHAVFGADPQDPGLMAVHRFLARRQDLDLSADPHWPEIVEAQPNLSLLLEGDTELIAQRAAVRAILDQPSDDTGATGRCLITGEADRIATLHTAIKGVRGAQTSGANIVSFNQQSFDSHGLAQGANAPVGRRAEFAYTTALNHLLRAGSPQRVVLGETTVVFWSAAPSPVETLLAHIMEDPPRGEEESQYGAVRGILHAAQRGVPPGEIETQFYTLGLAPNAARLSIRFWHENNAAEICKRVAMHVNDLAIARSPYDPEYLSLYRLLRGLAVGGKITNLAPRLAGELLQAVLVGTRYPRSLLVAAVQRCKAEREVPYARAALLKAVLTRDARLSNEGSGKEIPMTVDTDSDDVGYVLGRLFAVLERAQELSSEGGRLNKTIRDTSFGAACSTPVVTFVRLQKLAIHHLAKIRNSGRPTTWLEQQFQEIQGHLPAAGIPATLPVEEQARFAIGYYHQRKSFFESKNEKAKEGNEA